MIIYKELARVNLLMGNYKDSIAALEKCQHLEKNQSALTLSDLANVYIKINHMDQFSKGLSYAEEAIKLDNECAQAWLNRGVLQQRLNMRK